MLLLLVLVLVLLLRLLVWQGRELEDDGCG